ncbi:IS4 family transposase [bacterium]|nr:IS4 family transposase [bacterium]
MPFQSDQVDRVEAALREEGATWRRRVYTPAVTLWAFLAQVADPDRSCRAAVARVLAGLAAHDRRPARPTTGAYCKARARLPEGLPRRLAREAGRDLHRAAADGWRWRGRRVKVADGTTVSMPDTRADQRAYPQPEVQKPGLGFPVARVVAVFCLATGAVLDAALGRCPGKRTGEAALLRNLAGGFDPGDVVLADRGYSSLYDLAGWVARGVDVVVRLHQARRPDFRTGRRLGPGDHVTTWGRPDRPGWVDDATLAGMPRALAVREVAVRVPRRGFRTRRLVVATTLVDAARYPAAAPAELYRARWHAELDLRSLKCTLGVDVLRCRTPEMVRKEFWMHVLAYNLVRAVAARAARGAGVEPREVSFAGTLQAVRAFAERLAGAGAAEAARLHERLLVVVGAQRVGDRPDRVEPRARKRRPKHGALLTKPRDQARAELLKGVRT